MTIFLILALIAVVAGCVLGAKNAEYKTGMFWLLIALVLITILPAVRISA